MEYTKPCFKCGEVKPLSSFYRHPKMKDGHVNKCKECNKIDVRENRKTKIDYYRDYDRERGNRQGYRYVEEYREKYPKKYFAACRIGNMIRSGELERGCCEVCGTDKNIHGHHDDYNEPERVRWLCAAHHRQWHVENGEARNPF